MGGMNPIWGIYWAKGFSIGALKKGLEAKVKDFLVCLLYSDLASLFNNKVNYTYQIKIN